MSVKGYYTLALSCDADCNKADDYSAYSDEFTCESRFEALESARKHGWSFSHQRKGKIRAAKCYCPFHAEERRSFHYRVPKK